MNILKVARYIFNAKPEHQSLLEKRIMEGDVLIAKIDYQREKTQVLKRKLPKDNFTKLLVDR
jgi:hypothetical protein